MKAQDSDNLDFFSLHAFLAAGGDERYFLAFFQAFETFTLNCTEVYKQIFAGLWSNETKAFFIVKPLNGTILTFGHCCLLQSISKKIQANGLPILSARSNRSRNV